MTNKMCITCCAEYKEYTGQHYFTDKLDGIGRTFGSVVL